MQMNKINITILSDIHLECNDFDKIHTIADWAFICGDIGNPFSNKYSKFIDDISKKYLHIFIISGNHEYHQLKFHKRNKTFAHIYSIEEVNAKIESICNNYTNVHYMNKRVIEINNIKIVGCTLWSKCNDDTMCDISNIKNFSNEKYREIHAEHKKFLEENTKEKTKTTIVMTHHMPSYKLIHPIFKGSHINSFFCSDMEYLMNNIDYWFYGHTHKTNDIIINNCRCINNAKGHSSENTGYNKDLLLELSI